MKITLTPAVLRALVEGLDRLNDGDPDDRRLAEHVEYLMFTEADLVLQTRHWVPKDKVTQGYILGGSAPVYAIQNYVGEWTTGQQVLPPGTEVYRDSACAEFMRKTD